jgi:serine/threonine protein phosphatase PrpC
MVTAHGLTHQGHVRKTNEDSLLVDVGLGLFVVADGMGGHIAGEVASQLAVDTFREFITRARAGDALIWPFGRDERASFDANCMTTAMKLANQRVLQASEDRDDCRGMGTTVAAALIDGNQLTYGGVGDSRLYAFLGGRLQQLSRDDSWLADVLERDPTTDPASLETHRMRHVLTNVIGALDSLTFNVIERTLQPDEVLLLCSDGLHGPVDDAAIGGALMAEPSIEQAAHRLIDLALDRGGKDNVTVLLIQNR